MALPEPITTEADVHAWRALVAGKATDDQQRRCVDWLVRATLRADTPYVSGDAGRRDTDYLLGRHSIGVLVGSMTSPEALTRARAADAARANPAPSRPRPTRQRPK